eukprot:1557604-Rhodomonas_salina.1
MPPFAWIPYLPPGRHSVRPSQVFCTAKPSLHTAESGFAKHHCIEPAHPNQSTPFPPPLAHSPEPAQH